MASLIRWEPFREMVSLRNQMDRLLDDTFHFLPTGAMELPAWDLALDVLEKEDAFEVKTSVPGLKPEEIDVTLRDNILTITGETKHEEERKEQRYHLRERRYGKFSRSVRLPAPVAEEKVEATYDQGVLTLHLPKAETARPRRIVVHGNGRKTIETTAKQ
jgi:HSP20 family protein